MSELDDLRTKVRRGLSRVKIRLLADQAVAEIEADRLRSIVESAIAAIDAEDWPRLRGAYGQLDEWLTENAWQRNSFINTLTLLRNFLEMIENGNGG